MTSAELNPAEVAEDQPVALLSSPAEEQTLNISQEVEPLEGQELAQSGNEEKIVQEQSEVSRYPSVSSQVLQNVRDLKDEILNGQHATVSAPQDADAEDEENEEQVDVVLKSFEIKREDERQEASQDKQLDTVEKPVSSEADDGAGLKRDAQSMLKSGNDQLAHQPSTGTAATGEERDAKRARYEQDQEKKSRTADPDASMGSIVDVSRKASVSESRISHKDSQAASTGRPRSPSRSALGQRGPLSDGRSLDPRNSRSYNDDRFSNSNRSGLSTYTDRLSSNSSRRDQERDRMEQARARGEPPYEQRSDRDYRDRERFERGSNDRRDFERPLPPDKEPKLSLRDRIEGIPPARRPSPPLSAASGGASGRSTTKYSRPPVPLNAAGHPIREPVRDDPRGEYDTRRSASGRERYDGPAGPPGQDNRAVSRTSSMPERITDPRSFPPKNATSYSDVKVSAPPSSRPPWEEHSRNSPPPSSAGARYSQPVSTYRSKEPPRSNPNVVYSRPPVPRDSIQPPSATRGSSPPPRRVYDAPSPAPSRSGPPPRDYAYGGPASSAPEPHVASRSTYDRYGAPAPPADTYRNDSRGPDYRAPPPVGPPSGRTYPSAGLAPVAVDPYGHPSYDRQPPQYDRYGRPIPLDQGPPPASYAPPPVARSAPVYAAPPPVSDVDAELEGLKLRLLELERCREAERDAEIARTMPRSFQNGPPVSHMPIETGYGSRGESINNGRGYVPREREREREREPAGSYPSRNAPPLAERREPVYVNPRNGPSPGDFPPRNGPVYRASGRRTPPPMAREDRSRR